MLPFFLQMAGSSGIDLNLNQWYSLLLCPGALLQYFFFWCLTYLFDSNLHIMLGISLTALCKVWFLRQIAFFFNVFVYPSLNLALL